MKQRFTYHFIVLSVPIQLTATTISNPNLLFSPLPPRLDQSTPQHIHNEMSLSGVVYSLRPLKSVLPILLGSNYLKV